MDLSFVKSALLRAGFAIVLAFGALGANAQTITPPNPSDCPVSSPPMEPGSTPSYPGRWWNPDRYGTGWDFLYSPLLDAEGKIALYWFTFDTNGTPTWLMGSLRKVASTDGHNRFVGFLYAPYFEYRQNGSDGYPLNAVSRADIVGEIGVTYPAGTTTRAAVSWTWNNNGRSFSGNECLYDAFRDQPPRGQDSGSLNQAFTGNWFDPTRASRGIGSWGFDLVIGRTPDTEFWHQIVTAQVYDENGKAVWLQYAEPFPGTPPPLAGSRKELYYTRAGDGYLLNPNNLSDRTRGPTQTCTAAMQAASDACITLFAGGQLGNGKNYFSYDFTGANAGKVDLRVNVESSPTIEGDPSIHWPPASMDLPTSPPPPPYATDGANVRVARTTEVDRIIADRTLCVVRTVGDTCHVTISYTASQGVYVEKLNLDTNVPELISTPARFGIIDQNLPVGSRYKYNLRASNGTATILSQTAEVRVVGQMSVPDQPVVPLDGDLPPHDPTVGTVAGEASTEGGSAFYRIPIAVPPGRAGMQPSLAVSYASNGGNGIAGMGTALSGLSAITRCGKTLAQDGAPRPVMYDVNDALCLDGKRLVLVQGLQRGSVQYRTEIDSFARITQFGSLADASACFRVEAKNGTVTDYGVPVSGSACGTDTSAKGRVTPIGLAVTGSWLVVKTADRVGNSMSYAYTNTEGGVARETLIDTIRYTDSATQAGNRLVRFFYQARPTGFGANDYGAWAAGGGMSASTRRLTQIATSAAGQSVREYNFDYTDTVTGNTFSNYSGRSLLRSVQECGFKQEPPYTRSCVASPTRFAWADSSPDGNAPNALANKDKFRRISLNGLSEEIVSLQVLGDVNGDGSREVLARVRTATGDQYRLVPTLPDRTFGMPIVMTTDEFLELGVPGSDDFDGDGLADAITRNTTDQTFQLVRWKAGRGTWPTTANTTFDQSLERLALTIPTTEAMLQVGAADFDGDGRPDIAFKRLRALDCPSGGAGWNQLVIYLNRITQQSGERGRFVEGPTACLASYNSGGSVSLEQAEHIGDFDGDGRADILISYKVNPDDNGRSFTKLLRMRTPASGSGLEIAVSTAASIGLGDIVELGNLPTRWIDVNGDGLDDFVYPEGSKWTVRLNRGSAQFSPAIVATSVGDVGLLHNIDKYKYANYMPTADVDGDGRADFLRPARIAAAMCQLHEGGSSCGDTGECDYYLCPDDPATGDHVVPPGERIGPNKLEARRLYGTETGAAGDSTAYYMNAVRFVIGPVGANGLPTISAVDTPTSIIGRLGGSTAADLYGDGLTDLLTPMGCADCTVATNPSDFDDPARPSYLPDGTPVYDLVEHVLTYVSENTGAGERIGLAHRLPELVSVVTDGLGEQVSWDYSPLSSSAGRTAGEIPLYTLPQGPNGYVDEDHIYFRSSMPVVASMWQSNGLPDLAPNDALGGRSFEYGYSQALFNTRGRGFLGFRTIQVATDVAAADVSRKSWVSTNYLQKYPFTGLVESSYTQVALPGGLKVVAGRTDNTWVQGGSPAGIARTFLSHSISRQYDASSQLCGGQVSTVSTYNRDKASETAGGIAWDEYGNLTEQFVVRKDADCNPFVSSHTTHTTSAFDLSTAATGDWWIDKLTSQTVDTSVTYLPGFAIPLSNPVTAHAATTTLAWNADRTPASQTVSADGQSAQTVYRYQPGSFGLPYEVEMSGTAAAARTTSITYTPDYYFVARKTAPDGVYAESETRPADGLTSSITDANGRKTYMEYDAFGRVTQSITLLADGVTVQEPPIRRAWTACAGGNCRAPGNVTPTGENPATQGRATYRVTTVQDGSPTSIAWFDMLGRSIKAATRGYDPRTTTFSLATSPWVQTLVEYDAFGKVARQSTPYCLVSSDLCTQTQKYWTSFTYDALGRVVTKTEPAPLDNLAERQRQTTYKYVGNRTDITVTRAGGGCTNCTLSMKRYGSVLGKILQMEDAAGGVTQRWYDGSGNVIAQSDPNGNVVSATYNGLGQRLSSDDPNRGHWAFEYNGLGELKKQTDARLVDTTFLYDNLGRVVERRSTQSVARGAPVTVGAPVVDETIVDTWSYHPGSAALYLRGQPKDANRYVVNSDAPAGKDVWQELYAYDPMSSRLKTLTRKLVVANGANAETFDTAFEYDATHNRVKVLNYPSGLRLETRYTPYGQPRETRDADLLQSYTRVDATDPWGNVVKRTYGNNSVGVYTPNASTGQAGSMAWRLNGGLGDTIDAIDYTYDVFGNLSTQTRTFPEIDGLHSYADSYTYDSLHRLTRAVFQEMTPGQVGSPSTVNYGYDPAGNLRWKDDYSATGFAAPYPYQYSSTRPNAVTQVLKAGTTNQYRTYAYDANGNLVGAPGVSTNELTGAYDAQNLPRRLGRGTTGAFAFSFDYGADGARYRERGPRGTKVSLPFGLERMANGIWRHELGDVIVDRKLYSSLPLDGYNTVNYAYRDRLQSTIAVADGNAQIGYASGRVNYDAFGKARYGDGGQRTSGNPLYTAGLLLSRFPSERGFTGQQHLDDVMLIHMNGRAYDYQLGRFLSVDPFIQAPDNSQSQNGYSYIMNNPLSGLDPSGYWARSPDNSTQCFGIQWCQDTRDAQFLGGPAGELRASVTYGGASSSGADIWGEARQRLRGNTAEGRLWTALTIGMISMRDIVDKGAASEGAITLTPVEVMGIRNSVRPLGTAASRAMSEAFIERMAGGGAGIWLATRVFVGVGLFLTDNNDFNQIFLGAPVAQCYGSCTCKATDENFCSSQSRGHDKAKDIRQPSHPMEGVTISTPAPPEDDGPGAGPPDHIVLGKTTGLADRAAKIGGRHLMKSTYWQAEVLEGIANPRTLISVDISGLEETGSVYHRVMLAVARDAAGTGSGFDWELSQLYRARALSRVQFYEDAAAIANPFK